MSGLDKLLSVLAPFDCLECGQEGDLLCQACLGKLKALTPRCYRCYAPSPNSLSCEDCFEQGYLYRVQAGTVYNGAAKDLVWRLKSNGAQAAANVMARRMTPLLDDKDYLIVPIPTATSRVRQRGYNQAALIARQLSRQTRLPMTEVLVRRGQAHQVGAKRDQRLMQLSGALRVTKGRKVQGRHVLLVDDVLTTGATLEAAAKILLQAGAAQVEGLTFAHALKLK